MLRLAREVATQAAYEAGRLTKERFGSLTQIEEKDEHGDLVTEADTMAEAVIMSKIQAAFPDHRIRSEEFGDNEKHSEWMWLVDPLDGTNNFAIGLPVFAVSITLMRDTVPVLAVIYEPMTDRLYTANAGEGAYCNGRQVLMPPAKSFSKARVGWIQGHAVQNAEEAVRLRHYIDVNTKRMMRLWAPTLQWCMLARGDLDGIMVYNSEGEDLYSGLLLAEEAGAVVLDFEGHPYANSRHRPYLIACHPAHTDYFLKMVHVGLGKL